MVGALPLIGALRYGLQNRLGADRDAHEWRTKLKRAKKQSPALAHVQHVWDNVSNRSCYKFNHALYGALSNAIVSGMKFEPNDFRYLASELRLGRWVGQNLDHVYSLACGSERASDNPSAVASIEAYLKREPFLWAEKTKTPTRLHVGAEFTWKGERVTVTSFNDKDESLVACSYKRQQDHGGDGVVGSISYDMGAYRILEAKKVIDGGGVIMRLSGPVEYESDKIKKRYTITASEMKQLRADYDNRRRVHERAFAAATTLAELDAAREAASAEGAAAFRHFDLEILTKLLGDADQRIRENISRADQEAYEKQRRENAVANLERWSAGEDVRDYFTGEIRIRVKDGFVEVSNGNKVTVDAARKTLAFVNRHRSSGWKSNGQTHDVDAFELKRVDKDGVRIGCTSIPWSEVDRCATLIGK